MQHEKIKITYILFQIEKALGFEWVADNINKDKFELSIISIGVSENSIFEQFCKIRGIEFHRIEYHTKKDIFAATLKTFFLLRKIKPKAVHCHIFEANLIGLTAALLAGIKMRIYTRHHSTYHHSTSPSGVKYDKYCNKIATHIIAISENVKSVLVNMEGVSPKKAYLVHHGFDLPFFYNISDDRQKQVQQKYNPDNRHPVVGVVSRYTRWKGIIYIINAFIQLLEKYPEALLVLANAKGEDKEIQDAIKKLPEKNYVEIVFENDNAALFKMFDVFVHVPIDAEIEAFGQIYIEALAVGVPCVFTLSGVSREFVKDGENALVVDFHNEEQIYHAVDRILEDADLRNKLVENGKKSIEKNFSLQLFIEKLETIYSL